MRILFFFGCISLGILAACSKNTTPETVPGPPLPPVDTTLVTIRFSGNFAAGPYGNTMGKALIVTQQGKLFLRLEDFTVSSGPDLKVYLAKEKQPINFINLGSLKALNGNQEYAISGNPDLSQYQYALIHCEQYNHLFGWAQLVMR